MSSLAPARLFRNGMAGLGAVCVAGWAAMIWSSVNMHAPMVQLMMPKSAAWSAAEAFSVWLMWAVMMGAMMLPSAVPMIIFHRKVAAGRGRWHDAVIDNRWFTISYLLVWSTFSAAATAMQWGLQVAGTLSRMLVLTDASVTGAILVAAGAYQITPFKDVCLRECRTPIGFLLREWRAGRIGAVIMGVRHGAYCVGCCWALMALLFVFGAMNIFAIAILASAVAVEKLVPGGAGIGRLGGLVLMTAGLWIWLA